MQPSTKLKQALLDHGINIGNLYQYQFFLKHFNIDKINYHDLEDFYKSFDNSDIKTIFTLRGIRRDGTMFVYSSKLEEDQLIRIIELSIFT